jgi:hypothetical protein
MTLRAGFNTYRPLAVHFGNRARGQRDHGLFMATIAAQIRGNAAHFLASLRLRLRLASGRRRETGITARQNHGRVALWTPVLFAAGIGGYFILPAEPEIWLGSAVLLIAGIGVIGLRKRRGIVFFGLLVVMIAAAGFGAAQFRNAAVSASALERRIGPVSLSGRVIRVEPSEKGIV